VPKVFTAGFGYFRLRKADYTPEMRADLRPQVASSLATGREACVYFKHQEDPNGALWAEELLRA
jgi:hypothetical protein